MSNQHLSNGSIRTREDVYFSGNLTMNVGLGIWSFLFVIYLALPLFGGKLSSDALLVYGALIICTIIGKKYFKRIRNDTTIKTYEGIVALLWLIISTTVVLPFPYGIIVGILFSSAMYVGHRKLAEIWKKQQAA